MVNPLAEEYYLNFSEGNPGALTAILELLQRVGGITCLKRFDKLNIKGWKIWVCYYNICQENLDLLIQKTLADEILPLLKETRDYKKYEKQELTE